MNDLDYLVFFTNYMIELFNNMETETIGEPVSIKVEPTMIKMPCPSCKTGFLEAQGSLFTPFSEEPLIYHKCDSCDFSDYLLGISYPFVKYIEINE